MMLLAPAFVVGVKYSSIKKRVCMIQKLLFVGW